MSTFDKLYFPSGHRGLIDDLHSIPFRSYVGFAELLINLPQSYLLLWLRMALENCSPTLPANDAMTNVAFVPPLCDRIRQCVRVQKVGWQDDAIHDDQIRPSWACDGRMGVVVSWRRQECSAMHSGVPLGRHAIHFGPSHLLNQHHCAVPKTGTDTWQENSSGPQDLGTRDAYVVDK